jgi:hypothetical protein
MFWFVRKTAARVVPVGTGRDRPIGYGGWLGRSHRNPVAGNRLTLLLKKKPDNKRNGQYCDKGA